MGEPDRQDGQPGPDLRQSYFAIVVSRFNSQVTDKLLEGAKAAFTELGVPEENVLIHDVPGAFELPLVAQAVARAGRARAIVALGCVIRGETSHYDYVCEAATHGLLRVSLDHQLPVAFGLLTTETGRQALDRAGGEKGNKGAEAVQVALEMCGLLDRIGPPDRDDGA